MVERTCWFAGSGPVLQRGINRLAVPTCSRRGIAAAMPHPAGLEAPLFGGQGCPPLLPPDGADSLAASAKIVFEFVC